MASPGQLGERGLPPTVDRLLRASAALTQRLNQCLQDACGLSLAQYQFLWAAAARRATLGELAGLLGCTRGNVTGLADRLADQDLVVRRHDPDDRRVAFIEVTPAGRARLEAAGRVVVEVLRGLDGDPWLLPLVETLAGSAAAAEPTVETGGRRRSAYPDARPSRSPGLQEPPAPAGESRPASTPAVRLASDDDRVVVVRDDRVVRIGPRGPLAE